VSLDVRDYRDLPLGTWAKAACVHFSPDGRTLASADADRTVRVWEVASGLETRTFQGHSGYCWSVAFSPDGRRLAASAVDGTIRLWEADPLTPQP
jgi:WD40 repeat protein